MGNFKSLLIFVLLGLSIALSPALAAPIGAASLIDQGFEQLYSGSPQQALKSWKQSEAHYRKQKNLEGVIGSQVNQSLALQALGLYPQACESLAQALEFSGLCEQSLKTPQTLAELIRNVPPTPARISGLISLGDTLRVLGQLQNAQITLVTLEQTLQPNLSSERAAQLKLSLANVKRSLYLQTRDRYERTDDPAIQFQLLDTLQQQADAALNLYAEVSQVPQVVTAELAVVNRLALLSDLSQWLQNQGRDTAWKQTIHTQVASAKAQLPPASAMQSPPIQRVYAQINLAESLMQLNQTEQASEYISSALQLARSLQKSRVLSYALGTMARLQVQQGQIEPALQGFQEAAGQARSVHAWDSAFRWHHEIGKIYGLQNPQRAEKEYKAAIAALQQIRSDLISTNPDVQFSFQGENNHVYREYLRLLLNRSSVPQKNLKEAIRVTQQLQQADLENFLRCGRLDIVPLDEIETKDATVFYVMDLGAQIAVVTQAKNRPLDYYSIDVADINLAASSLMSNLQSDNFLALPESIFLPHAQLLYQKFIAPAAKQGYLPNEGTLVFVLNFSLLQTIPISLFHDGDRYLVERYSVATTLGPLRQPKQLTSQRPSTLIAGLSEIAPSFTSPEVPTNLLPLPEVKEEVAQLEKQTDSKVLLDQNFTTQNFQTALGKNDFSVVHLTTHGQFSSQPEKTFILAWNQPIGVQQFYQWVKRTNDVSSIELLVLSACETAKGDKRSALGIAGLAAQAGARSTIASLWKVEVSSTSRLMSEFYIHLGKGKSKAEALRAAQLILLANPETSHPFYWAPFILVGSWL